MHGFSLCEVFAVFFQESEARKLLDEKFLPNGLKNIEKFYEQNNKCEGWFVGDEVETKIYGLQAFQNLHP